jgi:hypothetical protein
VSLLGGPRPVAAQEGLAAAVDRVWIRGDSLNVDYSVRELFSDRIRDGLERGLPMTLTVEIELWRDRGSWWDALEVRHVREYKIQRNVWDDRFFVDSAGGRRFWLADLGALERHLSYRRGEFVTDLSGLREGKHYFVVVIPTLKPLTIEDVREVEAWLTGEIETGSEKTGFSVITGLPRTVFGIFIDLAGLGDASTVARSGRFRFGGEESVAGGRARTTDTPEPISE